MTQAKSAPIKSEKKESFLFNSSLADDIWHDLQSPSAYEWWYFDALSDDGRDGIVVIFLDNFIFSPNYNRLCAKVQSPKSKVQSPKPKAKSLESQESQESLESSEIQNPKSKIQNPKFPAVAFTYYRDGKPVYRCFNEFLQNEFSAGKDFPSCEIGESSFQFEATPYGTRYILEINAILRGQRKLHASLEWLIVERDLIQMKQTDDDSNLNSNPFSLSDASEFGNSDLSNQDSHSWNLVSPRSDVTGKIEVTDKKGKFLDEFQFRGTGYHDHNFDSRWLPQTVKEWQWGRAHFADATAVFYRYLEIGASEATTRVFLTYNGEFSAQVSNYEYAKMRRDRFGLKYPKTLSFSLNETGGNLLVEQKKIIDSSFFYLRFLSEMSLDLGDGKMRETTGITEHLAPRALKYRRLDWLVNMRIGRNGKGAFLP